jgi:hypothetical protein
MTATISGDGTSTLINLTTSGNTVLGDASTDTLNVGNGGLVKDASGNVGIGTSSIASGGAGTVNFNVHTPSANSTYVKLSNSSTGNTASDGFDFICGADGGAYIYNRENQPIYFGTNNTERMRIDSSGNVGIGVTSPTSALYVAAQSDTAGGAGITLGNTSTNRRWLTRFGTNTDLGYYLDFYDGSSWNNRLKLTYTGDLLVGGTTQPIGTCRLVVQNSGASSNGAGFFFTSTDDRGNVLIQHAGATGATSRKQISFFNASGSEVGYVSSTGSATSYVTSSDYRLKENIAPMTDALSVVQQLKPVTYTWKDGGFSSQGFIAHELQKIVPECVVGEKDSVDAEGNPKYQGIDTSFLVATLTAAIQELKALVDTQASTITTLTDRITALEAKGTNNV